LAFILFADKPFILISMRTINRKTHYLPLPSLILSFVLIMGSALSYGQLNCKTIQRNDSTITYCYHANKKPSSIESWDGNKYWGRMQCFDFKGKEIINYQLRRVAGHASVYLNYFPNGQISKAEYSSAPDGGIQFYRIIHRFNEQGEQTEYTDLSQPDGRPVITIPQHLYKNPDQQSPIVKEPTKLEVIQCAVPFQTVYRVTNETRRKVTINLIPLNSQWATLKPHKQVIIKAKTSIAIDSIILAERFMSLEESYRIEIVSPKKISKQPKVITAIPKQSPTRKEYTWHLVEK
jgi:hypothetical protein